MKGYIDEITEFSIKRVTLDGTEEGNVSEWVLELAVPAGSGNEEQIEALGEAAEYAKDHGIKLKIVEVKK